uniref:Transformation/transcription domain-associated protein n=1 Tax=Timema douglasi TaxID=61478 RepID=A0A7R8VDP8_TIMDO|nr:unnamed protein product [Timema douglasi]
MDRCQPQQNTLWKRTLLLLAPNHCMDGKNCSFSGAGAICYCSITGPICDKNTKHSLPFYCTTAPKYLLSIKEQGCSGPVTALSVTESEDSVCDRDEEQGYFGAVTALPVTKNDEQVYFGPVTTMAPPPVSSVLPDPIAHINTFCSYVTMLADHGSKDEIKLRAAQELSENFEASTSIPFPLIVKCSNLVRKYITRVGQGSEIIGHRVELSGSRIVILSSSEYPTFLDHSMKKFLKILQDGEPLFIGEYNIQQVRKLILEMIHRFPSNDHLRQYVKHILTLMLKLLETDNEENALVCLRIINELHRHFRAHIQSRGLIQHFLNFVKNIYRELPNHLSNIFEPRPNYRVRDLTDINVDQIVTKIYSITPIYTDQTTTNGAPMHYNMIPKAVNSMKVLQELPIIVVLMYTLYKQNVHNDVMEFVPLVMTTITLQPSVAHRVQKILQNIMFDTAKFRLGLEHLRENPLFCKEVFVDFMGAQIKTLSFLAYLNRIYKEAVAKHAPLLVKGMLGMFTLCPQEVAHLRKELLIAARHILATDLRTGGNDRPKANERDVNKGSKEKKERGGWKRQKSQGTPQGQQRSRLETLLPSRSRPFQLLGHAAKMRRVIVYVVMLCCPEFVPFMDRLFDENILLGNGWTTNESLRPLAYSTLADLVHHSRQLLPMSDLTKAIHLFSRNLHDESLPTSIQTMSCKVLLKLAECICQKSEAGDQGRELLLKMLEVFVLKFKTISKTADSSAHGQMIRKLVKYCYSFIGNNAVETATSAAAPTTSVTTGEATSMCTTTTTTTSTSSATTTTTMTSTSTPITSSAESTFPPSLTPLTPAPLDPTSTPNPSSETTTLTSSSVVDSHATALLKKDEEKEKPKFGFPVSQSSNYNVADCRNLVKTLVWGVKTIVRDCVSCKEIVSQTNSESNSSVKSFHLKETATFIRLVKWAMRALDIYSLSSTSVGQKMVGNPTVRTEDEEKYVLEYFSGVFRMLDHQTLHELFSTTVEYLVERIHQNPNLQIVSNSLMAYQNTSPIFGMVMLEYLLKHMSEMGGSVERSNLYLRMFKLVFGSVSLLPQENEHMLKPHLHQIVNRSMELAMSAKDPYNYFLLLRALFRSIGGLNNLQSGPHKQHMKDLFVELCLTVPVRLSSLLRYLVTVDGSTGLSPQRFSHLDQSGRTTINSHGLRTLELCVDNLQPDFLYECIQPVRADLMQALWRTLRNPSEQIAHVAFRVLGKFGGGNRKMMLRPSQAAHEGPVCRALSHRTRQIELTAKIPVTVDGSTGLSPQRFSHLDQSGRTTINSHGLRTLELCVDNLQPDFLYECIQPVRADLMQALWRTLRNPSEQIAHVAFRVLGKFGGGNRKMMLEPQKLQYNTCNTPPAIIIHFIDHSKPVCLSVDKIIDTAFTALKTSTTDPFYRRHCWEIIRCYLVASLHLDDDAMSFKKLFSHPSFTDPSCKISPMQGISYKSADIQARATIQTAITGMFVASAIKELRQDVLPYMVFTVRFAAGFALSLSSFGREKQAGECTHSPFASAAKQSQPEGMDPLVLIDSLAAIIGHEEKELVKPCHLALVLLEQTCANVLGSLHRACQLPLMEYMAERMCSLCYERAWYSKMGGCYAIKFMFEKLDRCWVFEHLFSFLKALLFVMMDLTGEVAIILPLHLVLIKHTGIRDIRLFSSPTFNLEETSDSLALQLSFLKALLFVMMDLTGEVSSGAIELAKGHLERMLTLCAAPVEKGRN